MQSRLQSNSITSQPIPLKISGAKTPAVPLPQATTTLLDNLAKRNISFSIEAPILDLRNLVCEIS